MNAVNLLWNTIFKERLLKKINLQNPPTNLKISYGKGHDQLFAYVFWSLLALSAATSLNPLDIYFNVSIFNLTTLFYHYMACHTYIGKTEKNRVNAEWS